MENLQRNRMSKPNPHISSHLVLNTALFGLDWDECMHIRIVKDLALYLFIEFRFIIFGQPLLVLCIYFLCVCYSCEIRVFHH